MNLCHNVGLNNVLLDMEIKYRVHNKSHKIKLVLTRWTSMASKCFLIYLYCCLKN